MKMLHKEYLGDAVYVVIKEYEEGGGGVYRELVLTTEDGGNNIIVFEPKVLAKLKDYLDHHFGK